MNNLLYFLPFNIFVYRKGVVYIGKPSISIKTCASEFEAERAEPVGKDTHEKCR